ncbi:MAG: hypothetical protein AB7I27_16905 [Bacteriovoracaceae bacterium]
MKSVLSIIGFACLLLTQHNAQASDNCLNAIQNELIKEIQRPKIKSSPKLLELLSHEEAKEVLRTGYIEGAKYVLWGKEAPANRKAALDLYKNQSISFYIFEYTDKNRSFLSTETYFLKIVAVDKTSCKIVTEVHYMDDLK